ncbi:MAG: helix-turn-helix transcriptional regulator [Verrucomicrobiia bacterium]|jgi:proteasome accessory factor B
MKEKDKNSLKSPASRPPLERMIKIHQAIASGRYPNATRLSLELEVSTKSIYRDIEFMRDRMGLPIEFDNVKNGYYYTEPVENFPAIQISEGEFFALLVAEKALQQYRGTNFEKPLISAFKKMASALPEEISLHISDWEQAISFQLRQTPVINLEIFEKIASAVSSKKQLEILYKKPGQITPETRVIEPYHLANINGEWFLFAYDKLRKDIRTFVPARIQSARFTGESFVKKLKFSVQKFLRDSFGVHCGSGNYSIVIRFNENVADYIREKKWHESQQLIELPDGGVEMRLTLSSLVEIQRWILSWGGNAVVLEPPELASSVKEAAERILQVYSNQTKQFD